MITTSRLYFDVKGRLSTDIVHSAMLYVRETYKLKIDAIRLQKNGARIRWKHVRPEDRTSAIELRIRLQLNRKKKCWYIGSNMLKFIF